MTAQSLNADRPSTDPANDLYGHAPFAKTLATAISGYSLSDGIVMSLHGPWGSGKSTVLEFVQHYLKVLPEEQQPVVVIFNPWWFSGQDSLVRAFMGQLQAVLASKGSGFKDVVEALGKFSGVLGKALDLVAPGSSIGVEAITKLFGKKTVDVVALKKEIGDLLQKREKRILVIVDDIDRLAPDEVRQLFTVIKAIADFPYVTYLLAFDREVASAAISSQTGLPGDRFLEKIVQVPFELPYASRAAIHRVLFSRLDEIISSVPSERFRTSYWRNVFSAGLRRFFKVPRDVVRLTNALSGTFPAVAKEVNAVDFIAIECLRVFLPVAYDAIRQSPEYFTGQVLDFDGLDGDAGSKFHEGWKAKIPEESRAPTWEMLEYMFPRLSEVYVGSGSTHSSVAREWRHELRVCSPDVLPLYFSFSLPEGSVSQAEFDELLNALGSTADFERVFRTAKNVKKADGTTKSRALLERLLDYAVAEKNEIDGPGLVCKLMDIGDELLEPRDRSVGMFQIDFGNESLITKIVYQLLIKLKLDTRWNVVLKVAEESPSLRCLQYFIALSSNEVEKSKNGRGDAFLTDEQVQKLKSVWVEGVCEVSGLNAIQGSSGAANTDIDAVLMKFSENPSLPYLLAGWRKWGDVAQAKTWWKHASSTDSRLVKLINAFSSTSSQQFMGENEVRVRLRVNPKAIEFYEDDVKVLADRLALLLKDGRVSEEHSPSVIQFLKEWALIQNGQDPGDVDYDEE